MKNKAINPVVNRFNPETGRINSTEGMTLREHYVGLMLHAYMSQPEVMADIGAKRLTIHDVLDQCVLLADAMIIKLQMDGDNNTVQDQQPTANT